jgi:hypothetical protein
LTLAFGRNFAKVQGFCFFRPSAPDAGGIMSVWQCTPSATPLCGREGELVAVSISVSPRDLEALLEGLACVDFPINPQIHHAEGEPSGTGTVVEFPAYAGGLEQVRAALADAGFDPESIRVRGMLDEIQSSLDHETRNCGGDAG